MEPGRGITQPSPHILAEYCILESRLDSFSVHRQSMISGLAGDDLAEIISLICFLGCLSEFLSVPSH